MDFLTDFETHREDIHSVKDNEAKEPEIAAGHPEAADMIGRLHLGENLEEIEIARDAAPDFIAIENKSDGKT